MALVDTIRKAIATAKSVTASLQAEIEHKALISEDHQGAKTYASAVKLKALVELKQQERKLPSGRIMMTKATVTILEPVKPNGATGRVEPFDPRDLIVLPDGTICNILETSGFVDAGTERPYFTQLWVT
jgi:hypothetical protein